MSGKVTLYVPCGPYTLVCTELSAHEPTCPCDCTMQLHNTPTLRDLISTRAAYYQQHYTHTHQHAHTTIPGMASFANTDPQACHSRSPSCQSTKPHAEHTQRPSSHNFPIAAALHPQTCIICGCHEPAGQLRHRGASRPRMPLSCTPLVLNTNKVPSLQPRHL